MEKKSIVCTVAPAGYRHEKNPELLLIKAGLWNIAIAACLFCPQRYASY
jgi:hypothetical protein